jgi:hypothetical protein
MFVRIDDACLAFPKLHGAFPGHFNLAREKKIEDGDDNEDWKQSDDKVSEPCVAVLNGDLDSGSLANHAVEIFAVDKFCAETAEVFLVPDRRDVGRKAEFAVSRYNHAGFRCDHNVDDAAVGEFFFKLGLCPFPDILRRLELEKDQECDGDKDHQPDKGGQGRATGHGGRWSLGTRLRIV